MLDRPEVRERVLRPAAEILQKAAQANVRVAKKAVKRYGTGKFSKKLKSPKGKGRILAIYEPGNLKLSLQVLKFKRSKALFVGAKVMKRNPNGTFGKGKRADGWYAHFLEFGTKRARAYPFMRPAAISSAKAVRLRIKYGLELELKRWTIKNATK
jgi:HK97 gp10 family phage protein